MANSSCKTSSLQRSSLSGILCLLWIFCLLSWNNSPQISMYKQHCDNDKVVWWHLAAFFFYPSNRVPMILEIDNSNLSPNRISWTMSILQTSEYHLAPCFQLVETVVPIKMHYVSFSYWSENSSASQRAWAKSQKPKFCQRARFPRYIKDIYLNSRRTW